MLPLLFSYCSMQVQASVHQAAGSMTAECCTCCPAIVECWIRALLEGREMGRCMAAQRCTHFLVLAE